MQILRRGLAAVALLASATVAWGHGGTFQAPGSGDDPGYQVPPSVVDRGPPPAPDLRREITGSSWSRWWDANKDAHLELLERLLDPPGAETAGSGPTRRQILHTRQAELREAIVPLLIEVLTKDPSPRVRATAAVALGKTGDPRGSEPLRKAALSDPDDSVQAAGIIALGLLGRGADLPFLDSRLADVHENSRRRAFAAFSMGMIGGDDAAVALVRWKQDRLPLWREGSLGKQRLLAAALAALGMTGSPDGHPTLRKSAFDDREEDELRVASILGLGRAGDRSSIDELVRLLTERGTRTPLRRAAAVALGLACGAEDRKPQVALMEVSREDSDAGVRQAAIFGLARQRHLRVEVHLMRLFAAAEGADRAELALALGIQRGESSATLLAAELKQGPPAGRAAYCIALGLLGDPTAVPVLEAEFRDRKGAVREAALALGLLRAVASRDAIHDRLAPEVDPRVRADLAVALALVGDARAPSVLLEMFEDTDSVRARLTAAVTLGVLRRFDTAPRLLDAIRDQRRDEDSRIYAMVGLGFMVDPNPVPQLGALGSCGYGDIDLPTLREVLSIL